MLAELIFYVLLSGTLILAFFKWATLNRDYFAKRGIKHFPSKFLIGDTTALYTKRTNGAAFLEMIHHRFPKEKYRSHLTFTFKILNISSFLKGDWFF